jgi:acetylornithine/succinyldiaminopimelate/putrescine aminotransferase
MINTKHRTIQNDFNLDYNPLYEEIESYKLIATNQPIKLSWHKAIDYNVFDDKGNKWIDMTSGIFVANAGHANPYIKKALKKQIEDNLVFAYNYPTEIQKRFLKKLLEISPDYFKKVVLLNSGSEAVAAAYKIIKVYAKKNKKRYIVSFKGSYHGQFLSNQLIGGGKEASEWSNLKDDVVFLDFPYDSETNFKVEDLPPQDEIAAFLLETFQGWGAWFYPQHFIRDLYAFARKIGALVCFDEMQAGFYRLGRIYGFLTYGEEIKPDLICVGKGITSSLPLSAVIIQDGIVEKDDDINIHGTHSGNSLCCAAALANLEFLSDHDFLEQLKIKISQFENELNTIQSPVIVKKNIRGMIAGIIFKNTEIATEIVRRCIYKGLLPVCTNRNSIKLAPPLTIPSEALIEGIGILKEIIETGKFS